MCVSAFLLGTELWADAQNQKVFRITPGRPEWMCRSPCGFGQEPAFWVSVPPRMIWKDGLWGLEFPVLRRGCSLCSAPPLGLKVRWGFVSCSRHKGTVCVYMCLSVCVIVCEPLRPRGPFRCYHCHLSSVLDASVTMNQPPLRPLNMPVHAPGVLFPAFI